MDQLITYYNRPEGLVVGGLPVDYTDSQIDTTKLTRERRAIANELYSHLTKIQDLKRKLALSTPRGCIKS